MPKRYAQAQDSISYWLFGFLGANFLCRDWGRPAFRLAGNLPDLAGCFTNVLAQERIAHEVRDIRLAVVREPVARAAPAVDVPAQVVLGHDLPVAIDNIETILAKLNKTFILCHDAPPSAYAIPCVCMHDYS